MFVHTYISTTQSDKHLQITIGLLLSRSGSWLAFPSSVGLENVSNRVSTLIVPH